MPAQQSDQSDVEKKPRLNSFHGGVAHIFRRNIGSTVTLSITCSYGARCSLNLVFPGLRDARAFFDAVRMLLNDFSDEHGNAVKLEDYHIEWCGLKIKTSLRSYGYDLQMSGENERHCFYVENRREFLMLLYLLHRYGREVGMKLAFHYARAKEYEPRLKVVSTSRLARSSRS